MRLIAKNGGLKRKNAPFGACVNLASQQVHYSIVGHHAKAEPSVSSSSSGGGSAGGSGGCVLL